ncbi:MAG: PepSY domain-containing protein [Egibacteraceae bacterium]
MDDEDRGLVWEVDILAADDTLHEVVVDATSGRVVAMEIDD